MEDIALEAAEIVKGLDKAIVGYYFEKRLVLASLLAGGHVLLEGVPGIAKTTLVKALARLLNLLGREEMINGVPYKGFTRIQFTPDLMPSDITGTLVYNPQTREFEVKFGPIFAYIVLADEINRATPRTQSALLEAMQERQVTIGEKTYRLEARENSKFFLVAATQNPVEQEGTYPLPEAQLDRFAARIIMGYPQTLEEERAIVKLHSARMSEPLEDLEPCADPEWVVRAQSHVAEQVRADEEVINYTASIVRLTRPEVSDLASEYFELGA
ncbi:MAG: AAA family ATPase, partial [Infirmifilum sp.]|uniref:AAA family ATPase n=2 Tax=Infirmifilum sp. TaxID=2856575 RepID=UPI003D0EF604